MKIVTFASGHLVSLFPVEAFSPVSGLNERLLIGAISQRYNFDRSPNLSSTADVQRTGLEFKFGFFRTEAGEVTVQSFSIHNDGVVVRTNTTEHADGFFGDLINWLIEDFGCRRVPIKSHYLSEIVVDFERPMANALNNYNKLVSLVLSSVDENREASAAAFSSLSIEFFASAGEIPKFIIERRQGTTMEEERYFCSAPLKTEEHLRVLEEIERLLS